MQKQILLQEMRTVLRRMGYAYTTEKTYCDWVGRFVKFHQLKNRESLLVFSEKKVAPATQNQAFNALVFLYSKVLK